MVAKNADKVKGLLTQVTEVFDIVHHPSIAIRKNVNNHDFLSGNNP
jgi:hypothetical protein